MGFTRRPASEVPRITRAVTVDSGIRTLTAAGCVLSGGREHLRVGAQTQIHSPLTREHRPVPHCPSSASGLALLKSALTRSSHSTATVVELFYSSRLVHSLLKGHAVASVTPSWPSIFPVTLEGLGSQGGLPEKSRRQPSGRAQIGLLCFRPPTQSSERQFLCSRCRSLDHQRSQGRPPLYLSRSPLERVSPHPSGSLPT